jgi:hypothetical protein
MRILYSAILCCMHFVTFSQSKQEQTAIINAIEGFKNASNDSIKKVYLGQIERYYTNPTFAEFTLRNLNSIEDLEIDLLIGNNFPPIDSITDFSLHRTLLTIMELNRKPFTYLMIEQVLRNSSDASTIPDKENLRKKCFIKLIESNAPRGANVMATYYANNTYNRSAFNQYWSRDEIDFLMNKVLADETYYIFCYEKFRPVINLTGENPGSNLSYLQSKLVALNELITTWRNCKKCPITRIPEIFKSLSHLSSLNKQQRQVAIQPYLAAIKNGTTYLSHEALNIFKEELNQSANSSLDNLVLKYNENLNDICSIINRNYFSQTPIACTPITKEMLTSHSAASIISQALSFEFLNQYILDEVLKKTSHQHFSKLAVEEAFAEIAMIAYNVSVANATSGITIQEKFENQWRAARLKTSLGTIDKVDNTDPAGYVSFLKKRSFKRLHIKERKFDISTYRIFEDVRIKRKWWFSKKVKYVTDIPLKYRNIVRSNYKLFDLINYSFFERDADVHFGNNRPFEQFVDIIVNNPEQAVGSLKNAAFDTDYPATFTETEIRTKISTGSPEPLYHYIGLKMGFQKPFTSRGIFREVQDAVNASLLPPVDKASFSNAYNAPNLTTNRNYLNYLDSNSIFVQRAEIDKMHAATHLYRAHYIVNTLINRRAHGLPIKRDCKWYEFLWCNKDRNRKLNDERRRHINNSETAINDFANKLNSLKIFDIVSLNNPKTILPFYVVIDSGSKNMLCLVKVVSDNGTHIIPISASLASKDNLIAADKFWKKYDPYYLDRYIVDLSNLSDHGYEYFANLSELFIKENMTKNSMADRLYQNGFTKLSDFYPDTPIPNDQDNEFIQNLNIQSHFLLKERRLIDKIRNDHPKPLPSTISGGNLLASTTNATLNNALVGTLATINRNFDSALETWEEWFVFIGFTTFNGQPIPWIQFGGGSLRIAIALPLMGPIPAIPLPRNFAITPF